MSQPPRAPSLRKLVFTFAVGSLMLVVLTVAIGGGGLFLWQESSREALRINALVEETQGMRGSLYRQMKEVFDAVFLDDREAAAQYGAQGTEIDAHLRRLEGIAANAGERDGIARLSRAYREIRSHTDGLISGWASFSVEDRRRMLDTELEQGSLQGYERAFAELEQQLERQGQALQSRLSLLAWLSPLLLALPIVGAAGLLLWSRFVLQRAIIEPVVSVQRATEMISKGDLVHRVPALGAAELQQLAHSVNRMAADLAASRESLVRAEKAATLAALVPVVAHNIRNPLASIRATAQVMNDPSLPIELRDGLMGIIHTTDRLEHWTHALLSYLHPLEPQRALCRAGTLVDNMAAMLQPRLAQKNVYLDLSAFDRGLELNVDAHLVEQALHGLVLNAVEASSGGGAVRMAAMLEHASVVITIDDEGAGMPFSPDPRGLEPGPSTKRFGTGLGIPFAMKVFDVHGGRLRFAESPRSGTRVRITLPL